jgi:hypothetical protein
MTFKVAEEENSVWSFLIFVVVLRDILEYWVVQTTEENEIIGQNKRRGKDENCIRVEHL